MTNFRNAKILMEDFLTVFLRIQIIRSSYQNKENLHEHLEQKLITKTKTKNTHNLIRKLYLFKRFSSLHFGWALNTTLLTGRADQHYYCTQL